MNKDQAESIEKLFMPIQRIESVVGKVMDKIHKQPKGIHHINALKEICSLIGFTSCMFLLRMENTNLKSNITKARKIPRDKLLELEPQVLSMFENLGNISLIKNEMEEEGEVLTDEDAKMLKEVSKLLLYLTPSIDILLLPRSLFKKLTLLWDESDTFLEGIRIGVNNVEREQRSKNNS